MNHVSRSLRTGMAAAAALAVAAVASAGSALPASARELSQAGRSVNAAEWWLRALDAPAAWRATPAAGKGVTVAVLSTGVDASHPDLTGAVTTGPDYAKTGRKPGQAFWADEGTAVASLIAGHGHGRGGAEGITGIAPGARILSIQVTLEYNDPLDADAAIAGRLPAAIAEGIRYAVDHGASVIALPLDPGTLSAAGHGNPAAGGSRAERSAVAYAVAHDVLLVAPAGDNGEAGDAANYPAAYPGVLAVGATVNGGELALFTNTGGYVALTAPGASGPASEPGADAATAGPTAGLTVAAPGGGYQTLASTDMAAALTAGVAVLIRGRYPWLTAAEVTNAIEGGATSPAPAATRSTRASATTTPGWGHGRLNAARSLTRAAVIAAAHPRPAPATPAPSAAPTRAAAPSALATKTAGAGGTARSVLVDLLVAVCVLIAGLICALAVTSFRRRARTDASRASRNRGPGRHSRALALSPPPLPLSQNSGWQGNRPRHAVVVGSVWEPATPAAGRADAARAAGGALPPWEQSPAVFAAAPMPKAPPPWPLSSTGPMYVWNPAATTGPLRPVEEEQNQEP